MIGPSRLGAALLAAALATGCATTFPLPMTAAEMVQYNSGPALVAYLGQPDANPAVCDPRATGPHLGAYTPEIRAALVGGLTDGDIPPALWGRCITALTRSLPDDQVASLFDEVLRAYRDMVHDSGIERDPAFAERVATVQRLYVDRKPGKFGHPEVLAPILDDLRKSLAGKDLGPVARSFTEEMVASADVERGTWHGGPVDVALMDRLVAEGNEMTLTRFAERLPSGDLRDEARRRIIRVHIVLSAFAEVRAAAVAVEDALMKDGHNRVALADHPFSRVWFDEQKATIRNVLVRQALWPQTATLLGWAESRPTLSVLPEVSFRDVLWADLASISRPVTLCAPKSALDPSPCLLTTDVTLDNQFTYLDNGAKFHFRDNVTEAEVVTWANQDDFTLPVSLGGKPAFAIHWGLAYERPAQDLDFPGSTAANGPDLEIRVEHPQHNRYVFNANGYVTVVEVQDLAGFHVISRGGDGYAGSSGSWGSSGSSGGECQDGGPGGPGGDGGDGGSGGDGGNIHVVVACANDPCDLPLLHRIIFSAGGSGGPGGAGGPGGSGGSGGSGRPQSTHTDSDGNTVVDDPGCSAGSNGASGSPGANGSPGNPGRPGIVTWDGG